jgi:hypothetical protein
MFRQKRKPLLAVYREPAPGSPSPGIRIPCMRVIDGCGDMNERELMSFVSDLAKEAATATSNAS